jgi:hypothetical protein
MKLISVEDSSLLGFYALMTRKQLQIFQRDPVSSGDQNSVVCTATCYGLEGPGIESQWGGEIFRTRPD